MSVNNTVFFVNTDTEAYPLEIDDIRRELSSMSLPRTPTLEMLSELGYESVYKTDKPQDGDYVEDAPGKDRDGKYHQRWRPKSIGAGEVDSPYFDDRLRRYRLRVDGQRQRLLSLGHSVETSVGTYRVPLTLEARQYMTELLQWGLLQPQDDERTVRLPGAKLESFELPLAEAGQVILNVQAYVRKVETAYWVLHAELNAATDIDDLMVIYDNSVESEMERH